LDNIDGIKYYHKSEGYFCATELGLENITTFVVQNKLEGLKGDVFVCRGCPSKFAAGSLAGWQEHKQAAHFGQQILADSFSLDGTYSKTFGGKATLGKKITRSRVNSIVETIRKRDSKAKEKIKGKKNPELVATRKLSMEDIMLFLR
jgi:hypothetical protein